MINNAQKELYVELLKKTILFEIWLEHEQYLPVYGDIHQSIIEAVHQQGLEIVQKITPNKEQRFQGLDWPQIGHSMIGRLRMDNLQMCVETVLRDGVEGDFIETGVWRGGSCIFMRGLLKAHEITDRQVWVADSFEGLPAPNDELYPQDKGMDLSTIDFLKISLEQVQENFRKYDLLDEQVRFLKGWFKDTLPTAPMNKIAVLRLDGDLYESTMDSLTSLYHKVSPGGFIIIDDYCLHMCVAAVSDFREQYQITEPLIQIDACGWYWRKNSN
ncbi:TylF/MycF family methyltransferase [Paenibacillus terrigena]|uniref:TylF/MycF family methyltransferase n=1 Tax=Paenibacillus terrigena TaxID=369333 RepID=UPI0028D0B57F|nr:TylF/MycF family methyltransferase [Paenibacillus terrigena]